ncbi:MAG TPA: metallophosphoesterase [Gammaproteobacteria bacterium]
MNGGFKVEGKKKKKIGKRILLSVASLAVFAVIAAFTLLSFATVELTAAGAPNRLRIPVLPGIGDAAIPIFVKTGDKLSIPGFLDGPIVRMNKDGSWSATWFCEDRAVSAQGRAAVLQIECAGESRSFTLKSTGTPAAVAPMPEKVVVLSDLEGNIVFLDEALRELGIVNDAGDWQYETGHLVILGDSVDRGRDVFAVLWWLHDLAVQASASGGAVHVVLGNHDQYMLRTNPSKANRDHIYALNMMGGYQQAFADETVIGHWLRQQPVLLKLGSVLFAHGGVSPDVVRSGLSVEEINSAMKAYWNTPREKQQRSAALDAVLGHTGVTQYRGYFKGIEGRYPAASDAEIEQVLEHFEASQIVVAHTVVEQVKSLRDGRVYAVDVNSDESLPQVLAFENGIAKVINIGVSRNIGEQDAATLREFSLGNAADRKMLLDMYKDIGRLSALPYPY